MIVSLTGQWSQGNNFSRAQYATLTAPKASLPQWSDVTLETGWQIKLTSQLKNLYWEIFVVRTKKMLSFYPKYLHVQDVTKEWQKQHHSQILTAGMTRIGLYRMM